MRKSSVLKTEILGGDPGDVQSLKVLNKQISLINVKIHWEANAWRQERFGLLKAVKASEAEKVYVTHGSQATFSKYLNEIGIESEEVITEYGENELEQEEAKTKTTETA